MANVGDMLGSLKSRLGMGCNRDDVEFDEYDEYQEYDEYDDDYDDYDEYDEYSQSYGHRDRITTRSPIGSSLPRLVSRDDARDSTRSSSTFGRESFASNRNGRTMVDSSLPASMTPDGTSAITAAGNNRRAGGLDSLFGSPSDSQSNKSMSFNQYMSTSSPISNNITGKRNLQVIKPTRYDDAEGVTRALKLGNVAILVLTSTPDALAKRVLDFAFGATSALDGGVEGIGPKIYALTTNSGLTDAEKTELSDLGII